MRKFMTINKILNLTALTFFVSISAYAEGFVYKSPNKGGGGTRPSYDYFSGGGGNSAYTYSANTGGSGGHISMPTSTTHSSYTDPDNYVRKRIGPKYARPGGNYGRASNIRIK